jgi:hypothetical protein
VSGTTSRRRGESGQAGVELVAVLPLTAAVLAIAWQAVVAGHAAWAAAVAARAGARAAAVGGDPAAVARARLGAPLARDAVVRARADGHVSVSVPIPVVVPALDLGRVTGEGSFRPQDGP